MPWTEKTTTAEARQTLSDFLKEAGCYDICAVCPVYPGGEGCCQGCQSLVQGEGCSTPNLSCLSYTCGVLNEHLRRRGQLEQWIELTYGIPREGYRGCQRREDELLLQIKDPLQEVAVNVCILPVSSKEAASE